MHMAMLHRSRGLVARAASTACQRVLVPMRGMYLDLPSTCLPASSRACAEHSGPAQLPPRASGTHQASVATSSAQGDCGGVELEPHIAQLVGRLHSNDTKAVVYVTGGAVQSLAWLLSVPGASNTVLECTVPYARDSLADLLGQEPAQYCSQSTAVSMAVAAYQRAALLTAPGARILGVSATCTLATVPPKRGTHRAYLACHDGLSGTHVMAVTLPKAGASRAVEDRHVSQALLQLMARAMDEDIRDLPLPGFITRSAANGRVSDTASVSITSSAANSASQLSLAVNGDGHPQALLQWAPAPVGRVTDSGEAVPHAPSDARFEQLAMDGAPDLTLGTPAAVPTVSSGFIPSEDPLVRLLDGRVRCVEFAAGQVTVDAPRRNLVILPGSFNPLHRGHKELLRVAATAHGGGRDAVFELAVGNPDKGVLSLEEVQRRVAQFTAEGLAVVVTSASLFTHKAHLFRGSRFVVGWDTAIRLVMPKYYGGSEANMLVQFDRLRQAGCSFIVAGRSDPDSGAFKTLADVDVPHPLRDLFHGLGEDNFRVDLSSSQLRLELDGSRPNTPPTS